MNLRTTTVYDRRTLYLFNMRHNVRHLSLISALLILLCAYLFIGYSADGDPTAYVYLCCLIAFVIALPLSIFALPYFTVKGTHSYNMAVTLTFTEQNIHERAEGNGIVSEADFDYPSVRRVYRSRSAYYLYVARNSAIIVNRSDIRDFTEAELEAHLYRMLGEKKLRFRPRASNKE